MAAESVFFIIAIQFAEKTKKPSLTAVFPRKRFDSQGNLYYMQQPDPSSAANDTPTTLITYSSLPALHATALTTRLSVADNVSGSTPAAIMPFVAFDPMNPTNPFNEQVRVTREVTDALGHKVLTAQRLGNFGLSDNLVTTTPDFIDSGFVVVVRHEYDPATGQLLKTIDGKDHATEFKYYPDGKIKSEKKADDGTTYYQYDTHGNVTAELNEREKKAMYQYDALDRRVVARNALNQVTKYEYQGGGAYVHVTNARDFVTTTTNLAASRTRVILDPVGSTVYELDSLGNVIQETDPLGHTTKYTYDALNRKTKLTNALDKDYVFSYDVAGHLLDEIDPKDNMTLYGYDRLGRKISTMDGLGNEYLFAYDASGNLLTQTDPLQHVTQYQYDGLNRKIKEIQPDPDSSDPLVSSVTRFEYDAAGNLEKMIQVVDATTNPPTERVTTYVYDEVNRLKNEILPDPDEGGSLTSPTTTYDYDEAGNRISLTDPEGNTIDWVYDALNRVKVESNQLGDSRHFEYDAVGNLEKFTDRTGRVIKYEYDGANRRTHEKWLNGSSSTIRDIVTNYDNAGHVTSVSDDDATVTYSDFDNLGRPHTVENDIDLLGQTAKLTQDFDDAGNREYVTVAAGSTSGFRNDYTYDELNRVDWIKQSGANVEEKSIDYDYDDAGRLDKIKRYADDTGTELVITGDYTFDNADRLTHLTYTDAASTDWADYEWGFDTTNRITNFDSQIDGAVTYGYDETDQLKTADYNNQSDESYSYDENGNRTGGGYEVDSNNLTMSDGTYRYLYDAEGNRAARYVDGQSSGTGHEELSTGDTDITEYVWDYRNRLIKIIQRDAFGGAPTKIVEYTYDPLNRRVAKSMDADGDATFDTRTLFIHEGDRAARDGAGDQIFLVLDDADLSDSTPPSITHRYLQGAAIDQILADEDASNDVLWPLADNLGTIRDLAEYNDSTDTTFVANHIVYDAFGNVTSETDDTVDHLFGFTGREFDAESMLQYNRARYYDSALGQWIGEDPIGFEASDSNLRRYADNRPTVATDPSGLFDFGYWMNLFHQPINIENDKRLFDSDGKRRGFRFDESRTYWNRDPWGNWVTPCVVCHGRDGYGRLPGLTLTDSFVNGKWYHSGDSMNISGNYSAGMASGALLAPERLVNLAGYVAQAMYQSVPISDGYGDPVFEPIFSGVDEQEEAIEDWVYPERDRGSLLTFSGRIVGDQLSSQVTLMGVGKGFTLLRPAGNQIVQQLSRIQITVNRNVVSTNGLGGIRFGLRPTQTTEAILAETGLSNDTIAAGRRLIVAPQSTGKGFTLVGESRGTWTAADGRIFTNQAEYVAHQRALFQQGRTPLLENRGPILGGSYRDVRAANVGGDIHHMPADSVSPLSRELGPAIHMPTPEHAQTASFGNSRAARAYRAQQQQLIQQGRFMDAVQMDINDVRNLFGNRYDEHIRQMFEWIRQSRTVPGQ